MTRYTTASGSIYDVRLHDGALQVRRMKLGEAWLTHPRREKRERDGIGDWTSVRSAALEDGRLRINFHDERTLRTNVILSEEEL